MQLSLKIPKFFHQALVMFLGIAVFFAAIFFHQPVDAATQAYRQMAKLGLVDAIVTPQEIGLDYLAQPPIELAASGELMQSIQNVHETASRMPEDLAIAVDFCTNSPVRIGNAPKQCNSSQGTNYQAVGYINSQGKPKNITAGDVTEMAEIEYRNDGNLTAEMVTSSAQNILLADASGSFLQARRIPTFNLIIRHKRTGRQQIVRQVNANAFCRDVLNSFLNRKVRRA